VFNMNGTDDGLAVVTAGTAGSAKSNVFTAGITTRDMDPGQLGEVQVYGLNRKTTTVRATRAATTDAWATMAAIPFGSTLGLDLANNVAGVGGQSMAGMMIAVAENVAAGPTLPATAGSGTRYEQGVKTFLRFM
jgi:hypothetical protein